MPSTSTCVHDASPLSFNFVVPPVIRASSESSSPLTPVATVHIVVSLNCGPVEETLSVLTLGLSPRLQRSLATTNAAESLISRTRHVKRNVKRWRGGQMMLRWAAAGVLEAAKGFRRLKGHADMPQLVAALRARDQRLGLKDATEVEQVA